MTSLRSNLLFLNKVVMIYGIAWVLFESHHAIFDLPQYKDLLYAPGPVLTYLFPNYPPIWLIVAIALGCIGCMVYLIKKPSTIWARVFIAIGVTLLNLPNASTAYTGHHNHFFIHMMILLIFFPPIDSDEKVLKKAVTWFLFGLLITYSLSGFWKFFSIVFFGPWNEMWRTLTWWSNDALWILSARKQFYMDGNYEIAAFIYEHSSLFHAASLFYIFIQLISVAGAFFKKLLWVIIPVHILFHLTSGVILTLSFYPQLSLIILLFFPYHYLPKAVGKSIGLHSEA